MSKELAFQECEKFHNESSDLLSSLTPSPKDILIQKLKAKDVRLSYSSLKTLDSPVNFLRYFLDKKEKTKSQSIGSLVDCLVLTPNLFESTFEVVNACPTTDLQSAFCQEVIRLCNKDQSKIDGVFDDAFKSCYAKGSSTSVAHLKPYIAAILGGKDVVDQNVVEKAKWISENLLSKQDIQMELSCIESTQKELDFEYNGWRFKSKLDTYSRTLFHDLKFASDCTIDKFEFDVRKYNYDIQFGLYDLGLEILGLADRPVFKFIVFDDKGNYSIIEVDRSYIMFARRKVDFLIRCLDKMIAEDAFDNSYDFFRSKSIIYKPNWVKGMDYEIFDSKSEI